MSEGQEGQEGQPGVGGGGAGGHGGKGGTSERDNATWLTVVVIAMLAVSFGSLFGTIYYTATADAERKAADVATCERGNVVRRKQNAVIVFLHEKMGFAGVTVTPLADCSTIK